MARGQTPHAKLIVGATRVTADEDLQSRQQHLAELADQGFAFPAAQMEKLRAPQRAYEEHQLKLTVQNTSAVSIRDFVLAIEPLHKLINVGDQHVENAETISYFCGIQKFRFPPPERASEFLHPPAILFPGQSIDFPGYAYSLHIPTELSLQLETPILNWTIYLDHAPPSAGEVLFGSLKE